MTKAAPGKSHRKGISLVKLTSMFPTDEAAQEWFESVIWPNGPHCPHCGSLNVQAGIKHRSMTHRCRDCPKRPMFSLKTGTAMEGSKLGYRVWAMAIYLLTTNLKSVSSMKLHRGLDICQKSAWFLAHRLREGWTIKGGAKLDGPVEVDETYVGGKRKNMSNAKRKELADTGADPLRREWRTPPLWGIGLTETVSGTFRLLHDGRADGLMEAILWHGGEAAPSRDRVAQLSEEERERLLAFLRSL